MNWDLNWIACRKCPSTDLPFLKKGWITLWSLLVEGSISITANEFLIRKPTMDWLNDRSVNAYFLCHLLTYRLQPTSSGTVEMFLLSSSTHPCFIHNCLPLAPSSFILMWLDSSCLNIEPILFTNTDCYSPWIKCSVMRF